MEDSSIRGTESINRLEVRIKAVWERISQVRVEEGVEYTVFSRSIYSIHPIVKNIEIMML